MKDNSQKPDVFDYLSSREFIRAFIQWGKANLEGFTHRTLAEKLVVSSSGFIRWLFFHFPRDGDEFQLLEHCYVFIYGYSRHSDNLYCSPRSQLG